jgi:acyl-CoA thioesterase 11
MSWIDICAGIAAKTHTEQPCVTASVDAIHFLNPIFVGDVVIVKAAVNKAWRTSMEIGVRVEAEHLHTGEKRYCCHGKKLILMDSLSNG